MLPPALEIFLSHALTYVDSLPASAKAMTVASRREQRRPSLSAVHNPSEEHPDSSATQRIPPESENLEPLIIASPRDLDEMVHDMLVHYEGRESEDNWVFRERNTFTLRRLARGNAPHDFLPQYLGAMKSLLDGIFKTVNSLRTTLSTNGCLVIQDLAKTCGPKIDPMVEIILQNLLKLCCGMKKITTQAGSITVEVVIDNVTYTPRILQHVSGACQDKNANLRIYASGWLKLVINKQARHKGSVEHNGNLDIFEKCIRKGLSDANPTAREAMRVTFWVFFSSFPDKANEYVDSSHEHGERVANRVQNSFIS